MLLYRPQLEAVSLHLEGVADGMLNDTSGSVYESGFFCFLFLFLFILYGFK